MCAMNQQVRIKIIPIPVVTPHGKVDILYLQQLRLLRPLLDTRVDRSCIVPVHCKNSWSNLYIIVTDPNLIYI